MHGELTATSTADVCRDLASEGTTGVLTVTHRRGEGRIVFERGRIVGATSPAPGARIGDRLVNAGLVGEDALAQALHGQAGRGGGSRPRLGRLLVDAGLVSPDTVRLVVQEQVIDAVFELTAWEDGSFAFSRTSPEDTPEVPLSMPVDQLLVEVARRRDEWEALSRVIPDLGAVPRFREGTSGSTASLEPDEFAVLASVDGHRSVRELAEDLGYGEFEAARVIYALVLLGQVEVVRPVDEVGAALDDALGYEPPTDAPQPDLGLAGDLAPGDLAPGDLAPGDLAPGDLAPGELAPGDRNPAESTEPTDRWAVEHEGVIIPAEPPPDHPADAAAADGAAGADHQREADSQQADEERKANGFAAFAELRAFTADGAEGATPPTPPEPPHDQASAGTSPMATGASPPAPDPPTTDDAEPDGPTPPQDPPRPAAGPKGDVSEFLRELSRLALDDEPDEAPPAAPPPSRPTRDSRPTDSPGGREPSSRTESKRKRRLFGRGG